MTDIKESIEAGGNVLADAIQAALSIPVTVNVNRRREYALSTLNLDPAPRLWLTILADDQESAKAQAEQIIPHLYKAGYTDFSLDYADVSIFMQVREKSPAIEIVSTIAEDAETKARTEILEKLESTYVSLLSESETRSTQLYSLIASDDARTEIVSFHADNAESAASEAQRLATSLFEEGYTEFKLGVTNTVRSVVPLKLETKDAAPVA